MPKAGLIHDYDLMANRENAAQGVKCAVCDTQPTSFQWSDYHGEGMCTTCGCTYQLKGGTKDEEEKNEYPYMTMFEDFVPIARDYWKKNHKWVHYGTSLSRDDGMPALIDWVKVNYPEYIKKREEQQAKESENV